ncbi:MAG: hypothetical protein R2828_24680 [Saprospiraceae bacterium]
MTNQVMLKKVNVPTADSIIESIRWTLKPSVKRIYPFSHLQDDLHLDTIDLMLLIANLEYQFDVYLTPEEVASIETVQDASFYFQKHAA